MSRRSRFLAFVAVAVAITAFAAVAGGAASARAEEAAGEPDWKAAFNQVYRLEPGQAVKRVPPPYIPQRLSAYLALRAGREKRGPDYMIFHAAPGGEAREWGHAFGGGGKLPLRQVLSFPLEMNGYEFEGPDELLSLDLIGDWVINPDASQAAKLNAITHIIRAAYGRLVRFERREVERDAIVAAGRFELKPLPDVRDPPVVFLFTHFRDPARGGQRAGDLGEFFRTLGQYAGCAVVDETAGPKPKEFDWVPQSSAFLADQKPGPARWASLRKLLDNVSAQTGLTLELGRRKVPVWMVVEGPAAG